MTTNLTEGLVTKLPDLFCINKLVVDRTESGSKEGVERK